MLFKVIPLLLGFQLSGNYFGCGYSENKGPPVVKL